MAPVAASRARPAGSAPFVIEKVGVGEASAAIRSLIEKPTLRVPSDSGSMIGTAWTVPVISRAMEPAGLVAVTVKRNAWPRAVGVPVIAPVCVSKARPLGKAPAVTAYVGAGTPPA